MPVVGCLCCIFIWESVWFKCHCIVQRSVSGWCEWHAKELLGICSNKLFPWIWYGGDMCPSSVSLYECNLELFVSVWCGGYDEWYMIMEINSEKPF